MTATRAPSTALERLLSGLGAVRMGSGWMVRCPCHEDQHPSLSISERDGRVLVHCFAGCAQHDLVAELRRRGLWPGATGDEPEDDGGGVRERTSRGVSSRVPVEQRKVTKYEYRDAADTLVAIHKRIDLANGGKEMPWLLPDGTPSRNGRLTAQRLPLYRLPDLLAAPGDERVFLVEGEKAADAARAAGLVAVSPAGGAGQTDFGTALEPLSGRDLVLWPDNDEAGRALMGRVGAALHGSAASLRVLDVPNLPPKGDAFDFFAAGRTVDELDALCCAADPQHDGHPQQPYQEAVAGVAPVGGEGLLDEVADFLAKYVSFPSPEARDAVALWAAHAHAMAAFESTPRLALLSAEKQSGKTRCLEVLELLVPEPKHAANLTAAALFRLVGREGGCTLLFDEIDVFFGNRASEHEDLRGLLNAGHRRGAVAYRCVGDGGKMEVREFPAFCAVALAGIGDLPDTILDRSILIRMRRRAPGETVQPFRQREASAPGHALREQVAAWVKHFFDALRDARPAMPDGIVDRPADVWEPLIAIADVAGGEWPARARRAAARLNGERQSADPSLGTRLLADVRAVFDDKQADRLPSAALVDALVALEEAPWGEIRGKGLDTRGLARRLKPFSIAPKVMRMEAGTPRGYQRADFADAWRRYLPASPVEAQQPQHAQPPESEPVADGSGVAAAERNTIPEPQQPHQVDVAAVALVALSTGSEVLAAPEDEEVGEWSA